LYYLSVVVYGLMALGIGSNTELNKGCIEDLQSISVDVFLFLHL